MNLLAIQICEDDEEIKTLLVKHGKQTHLIPRVTQYRGFLLPADNGYKALRIPLTVGTAEQITQVISVFIKDGQSPEGLTYNLLETEAVEVN